ncbi:DUF1491 family protein [Devosia sp. RR2S18]|uniref:DUF1491 family protein n=1 Tax=Devosia rhizosphaerae TaxID=3049774 RepID=UPI00253FE12D|nr:DUF1491 family protein [Devosia sp. RR2S18]WIJ24395.1 DUF1491 family protein [Devosia sp. RR2S18]
MSRLRTDIWCGVFVRRHNDLGHMCVVSRRGDPVAGQVFVEVDHLDGTVSLFTPAPVNAERDDAGLIFQRRFARVDASKVRDRIEQEARFDPDLWVISLDLRGDDAGLDLTP